MKTLLLVEVVVCFATPTLFLLFGAILLPWQVYFLIRDPLHWEGPVLLCAAVVCGIVGLCGLSFVMQQLLRKEGASIRRPILVLGAFVVGSAPLVPVFDVDTGLLMVAGILPIVSSIHILFLARRLLFPLVRPGSGQRSALLSAAAIAWVLVMVSAVPALHAYASEKEMHAAHARWLRSRPLEYSYGLRFEGWTAPELHPPRRIVVAGDRVIEAEYALADLPGMPAYPPARECAWTMDTVFEELLAAKQAGARVRASFDPRTGYVRQAIVEYDGPGQRWTVNVTEFVQRRPR
jgi:hypothetical protein